MLKRSLEHATSFAHTLEHATRVIFAILPATFAQKNSRKLDFLGPVFPPRFDIRGSLLLRRDWGDTNPSLAMDKTAMDETSWIAATLDIRLPLDLSQACHERDQSGDHRRQLLLKHIIGTPLNRDDS